MKLVENRAEFSFKSRLLAPPRQSRCLGLTLHQCRRLGAPHWSLVRCTSHCLQPPNRWYDGLSTAPARRQRRFKVRTQPIRPCGGLTRSWEPSTELQLRWTLGGVEQVSQRGWKRYVRSPVQVIVITVANESDGVHRRPLAKGAEGLLT